MALFMKSDAQPLVSVLTPVYNGEKYLAECIESVLAQTYQNWEYYIFNNCSTDRTFEIAKAYGEKDARIRVITNSKFVGRQENHNIAFRHIPSSSIYCKVVHADDWLFPECVMKMVELAEADSNVAIVGAYGLSNAHVLWVGLDYKRTVFSGREICRQNLLGGRYLCGTPTSMLIRSDVIRNRPTFYNEVNEHADQEVCFDILRDRDFGFVHQVLTYTRVHSEAASALSDRFNTYILGYLEVLTKYGRTYLTSKEYEQQIKQLWDRYYAFLGSKVFRNNGEKGFWEFHRTTLDRLGYSFSMGNVAKAVLVEVLDVALNPLNTSKRIARKITSLLENTTR
jgi:glycosyltransferase involved in cell wall biosynthesis